MPLPEEFQDLARKVNNWGRWDEDDERGTLNYITPEAIVEAARLVRRGAVFSLAIPFDAKGPQIDQPRRFNPIHRMMITGPDCTTGAIRFPGGVGFSDDMVIMPLQCATQWDALSHCFEDGRMYNGYDANEVSSRGAKRNGIDSKIIEGLRAQLALRAGRGERRLIAALKRREQDLRRDLGTARASLYPDGIRQERALSFVPFVARYDGALIERDAEAFAAVGAAYGLPKDDPQKRQDSIQAALAEAAEPPKRVAHRLANRTSPFAMDDARLRHLHQ